MSYLVWCYTHTDSEGATNALRFATPNEATHYANDLYSRWTGLSRFEIQESDDPVNYYWDPEYWRAVPIDRKEEHGTR